MDNVTEIYGPPGTGKTRTLLDLARAARGRSLYLSYTRAAAAEAVSRLPADSPVRPSTVHSLAFNAIGMNRASVVDRPKLIELSKHTGIPVKGAEQGMDEDQEGDEYLSVIQYANNIECSYDHAYEHFGAPGTKSRFAMFMESYADWKSTYGYMDFDDILARYVDQVKHTNVDSVFIDEAQDCTPLQWRAIQNAVSGAKHVYLAGDDDQAIYQWSGADPMGMRRFAVDHDDVRVLGQSHRLPRAVWQLAVSMTASMKNRVHKLFKPTKEAGIVERWGNAEGVVFELDEMFPNGNGALILTRDRYRLKELQRIMNQRLFPYDVYGGASPWVSKLADEIRAGKATWRDSPPVWQEFYANADLTRPVIYHLSTIHSAKGREHDNVVLDLTMTGRVELGCQLDRDAEVRVQYVGVTRAKDNLLLCGENPIL